MNYVKPNGHFDRDALRARVTHLLGVHWKEIEDHAFKTPIHTNNLGPLSFRITPNGLACALPVSSLAFIVYNNDVDGSQDWIGEVKTALNRKHGEVEQNLSFWTKESDFKSWKSLSIDKMALLSAPTKADASNTPNTNQEKTMTAMNPVNPEVAKLLDAQMTSLGLPPINSLIQDINARGQTIDKLTADIETVKKEASYGKGITVTVGAAAAVVPTGNGLPNLKEVTTRKASDVFGIKGQSANGFSFDVPVFVWDGAHPDVPAVDDDYIFRPELLMATLRSLVFNKPAWLNGHTGTGKSTAVTQIAARLGWPVKVLNLDSEISRMELMGRDGIVQGTNGTITQCIEGILPQALQGPYILIMDEIDFGRPDVMYAIQRVLEGNGLTLAEDAGRRIAPHAMFRMIATANTKGQGDDTGLYQGARIQSAAFLDRFTIWEQVSYLGRDQLDSLLKKRVPGLPDDIRSKVVAYTAEHQTAFSQREILTPISPRGSIALSESIVTYLALLPNPKMAVDWALKQTIMNRAPDQDAAVLKGIVDRVFK